MQPTVNREFVRDVILLRQRAVQFQSIAKAIGVSPTAFSKFLNGKKVDYKFPDDFAERLANALKLPLERIKYEG